MTVNTMHVIALLYHSNPRMLSRKQLLRWGARPSEIEAAIRDEHVVALGIDDNPLTSLVLTADGEKTWEEREKRHDPFINVRQYDFFVDDDGTIRAPLDDAEPDRVRTVLAPGAMVAPHDRFLIENAARMLRLLLIVRSYPVEATGLKPELFAAISRLGDDARYAGIDTIGVNESEHPGDR